MTDRELLKDAVICIKNLYELYQDDFGAHFGSSIEELIKRIDSALADTVNTDALELVGRLREKKGTTICRLCGYEKEEHKEIDFLDCAGRHQTSLSCPDPYEPVFISQEADVITDSEAAALIASYSRRVPRVMLDEIAHHYHLSGGNDNYSAIAAKYGYTVTEDSNESV